MTLPCINLYRTKDEAFYFKNSQLNDFYLFGGIHILPNNNTPYIQVTNTPEGLFLEDWIVKIIQIDDSKSFDISTSFKIIGLTNSLNGDPQIIWQLLNIPHDMGYNLVYLEVSQVVGEVFYSNPFRCTSIYADKTSRFTYKDLRDDIYQSIGFQTWFRQQTEFTELTTYYETSTQQTVTQAVKVSTLELYQTEPMAFHELRLLSMVLRTPYLYVDQVRASLFEAITFPTATAAENFGAFPYKLTLNLNDKITT